MIPHDCNKDRYRRQFQMILTVRVEVSHNGTFYVATREDKEWALYQQGMQIDVEESFPVNVSQDRPLIFVTSVTVRASVTCTSLM